MKVSKTGFKNNSIRRKEKIHSSEFYERGVTLHKRLLQDTVLTVSDLEAIGLWLEEFAKPNRCEEILAAAFIWYVYVLISSAPLSILFLPLISEHLLVCSIVPVLNLVLLETWQWLTQRCYLSRYDESVRFMAIDFASAIFTYAIPETIGSMITLRSLYYEYQFGNRVRLQDILPPNAKKQLESALIEANLTPELTISSEALEHCRAIFQRKRGFGPHSFSKKVWFLIQLLQNKQNVSNRKHIEANPPN